MPRDSGRAAARGWSEGLHREPLFKRFVSRRAFAARNVRRFLQGPVAPRRRWRGTAVPAIARPSSAEEGNQNVQSPDSPDVGIQATSGVVDRPGFRLALRLAGMRNLRAYHDPDQTGRKWQYQ